MKQIISKIIKRLINFHPKTIIDKTQNDPVKKNLAQGLKCLQEQDQAGAREHFEQVLLEQPENPRALHYMGIVLAQSGDFGTASELLIKAEQLGPPDAELSTNLGNAYRQLSRIQEAIDAYDRAEKISPNFSNAHLNRASLLLEIGNPLSALTSLEKLLAYSPNDTQALNMLGDALTRLQRHEDALECFEKAFKLNPKSIDFLINRGSALTALRRFEEAASAFREATERDPKNLIAHYNLGTVLHQGRISTTEALQSFNTAIQISPEHNSSFYNRANVLDELGRYTEAINDFQSALNFGCPEASALGMMMYTKMRICNWERFPENCADLLKNIDKNAQAAAPFMMLAVTGELAIQRKVADIAANHLQATTPKMPPLEKYPRHDRVRLAYFSADLRNHPVAFLTAELFELHDPKKFEVIVFSFGPYDEMTRRVNSAVEDYIDARTLTDEDVVNLARALEIDIAIDLGGYTAHNRTGIFCMRAAPIQISYLGYPGTMGGSVHDYLIADRILIPHELEHWYTERIIHLPVYQINDSKREISSHIFSRKELDLPEEGFVFCCFNNTVKFNPEIFDIWMRILKSVPDSVLFLLAGSNEATENLQSEAEKRGVSKNRIVLGGRLPRPEYLARYRACDLFLDTLPFNAGTTASDALWAGLPVLTCKGEAFAGRMAASLLTALKLPELITDNLTDYEHSAIRLASDKKQMKILSTRLAESIQNELLFNTQTITQHIESAYMSVYERHQNGLAPETFEVFH